MTKAWNKESVAELLKLSDRAVERALIAVNARQTSDEQASASSKHTNGRGFNMCHARLGSYYAAWCSSGKHLTGRHLDKGRQIALRYTQQLADIANSRTEVVDDAGR